MPIVCSHSKMEPGHSFKAAMRQQAASVAIVTARTDDGLPHGMVASSVIPVSMEPPSLVVAINRSASLHPVVTRTGRFMVNFLATQQHSLLESFSSSHARDQRFRSGDWLDAWDGDSTHLPRLRGALAHIDCVVDLATDYGTHTLFVGRVIGVQIDSNTSGDDPVPLVWLAGQKAVPTRVTESMA